MKLCHKQWWPGKACHQSALSDLAQVPANDCLMGPQCWDQQGLKAGFMRLLIQFVLRLFVEFEHVYRTGGRKREQKKGKECVPRGWPLRSSVKDLGCLMHLLSLGELGWGWFSTQTLRKHDAWLTSQKPVQHAVGPKIGAGWENSLLASLPVAERLSQLSNE